MSLVSRKILYLTLAFAAASLMLAAPADAVVVPLNAHLTGCQEVPPVSTAAQGFAYMPYDMSARKFSLNVDVTGITLDQLTGSHIYLGALGANGSAIYDLDGPSSWYSDTNGIHLRLTDLTFPTQYESDLLAGNTYINVNTAQYPAGEIRGQLSPIPEPATLAYVAFGAAPMLITLKRRRR